MSQMVQVVSMLEVPRRFGSVSFQSNDVNGAQNSLFLFCVTARHMRFSFMASVLAAMTRSGHDGQQNFGQDAALFQMVVPCAVARHSTGIVTSLIGRVAWQITSSAQMREQALSRGRNAPPSVATAMRWRTLLSSLCSCTPSSVTRQMRRKSPVVASRSGLLPSLSGVNMILVGGYGCWNVSFGSLLNFPVSSSTARASSSHGYGAAAAVRYGPSQSSGQIAPCDTL